jgi:hypothetical protein
MAPGLEQVVLQETPNPGDQLIDLIGTVDYNACMKAGKIRLEELAKDAPKTVEEYLIGVKPLMCRVRRQGRDIGKDDPDYRMKIWAAFQEDLNPIKTKEQNDTWIWMWKHRRELNDIIDFSLDDTLDYFAVATLENTYLLRGSFKGKLLETPQFLWLRVASALRHPDITSVHQMYLDVANLRYLPASPTLFNAGTTINQMSSCFLIQVGDNLPSILWAIYCIGAISKANGATGISLGALRSGSSIGHNGISEGTFKVEKIANDMVEYVSQGGHRPGAEQICLPIWHIDIFGHIEATKNEANRTATGVSFALRSFLTKVESRLYTCCMETPSEMLISPLKKRGKPVRLSKRECYST